MHAVREARGVTRTQVALLSGGLALAACVVYLPALSGGFVYDDHVLLGPSSVVRGPLWRIWFSTDAWDYWPLTWTTLWVEWRLWGAWSPPFHTINVALHALTALLLWRVLVTLRVPGAWAASLLFGVHPVTVESVAWISECKNTLSGALAFGAALLWFRSQVSGPRRRLTAGASIALFALALLAKTSVVVLPVILAGVEVVRGRRPDRRMALELAPMFGLALAAGLVTVWFQHGNAMSAVTVVPRGWIERLADASCALGWYVQKAYLPLGVAIVDAELPARTDPVYLAYSGLGLAAAVTVVAVRSGALRPLRLALAYQVAAVLPVLGLVDMAYFHIAPTANHLQYLALPGATALAGWALAKLAEGSSLRAGALAGSVLVGGLGLWTGNRASAYESELTLWRRASEESPGSLFAAWLYADQLGEAGRFQEALAVLEHRAESARDPVVRVRAQALWLLQQRRATEAVAAYAQAERIRSSPEFGQETGIMLLRAGEAALAVRVLEPIATSYPSVPVVTYWLAMARLEAGDPVGAEQVIRQAADRMPASAVLKEGLAVVLIRQSRWADARSVLAEASRSGAEPVEARLARLTKDGWSEGPPPK